MTEPISMGFSGEEIVRDLFPPDFEYKVVKCEVNEHSDNNSKFMLEIRVNVEDEKDVKQFLSS